MDNGDLSWWAHDEQGILRKKSLCSSLLEHGKVKDYEDTRFSCFKPPWTAESSSQVLKEDARETRVNFSNACGLHGFPLKGAWSAHVMNGCKFGNELHLAISLEDGLAQSTPGLVLPGGLPTPQ
ncbi:hypothetical protein P7K49_027888 [Saguinus oedipus]|uniref:Uncharacterized protein n=1 Tax=Saguinus oedipus TaxID=9490 RepID=A0ABQ9UBK1_SAGOE|nr:hypothetical protein P7K49_027888 [Saguinus oedipus]